MWIEVKPRGATMGIGGKMLGFVSDFLEKREGALTVFEDQGVSFHWFRKKEDICLVW